MAAVPNVPGVPSLRAYSISSTVLLVSDAVRALLGPFATRWGIFRNGIPVIISDNAISFELKQDFPISDYPVEAGGFQSYNKVQLPGDIRMRFSAGGSELNRQVFLASIDAVIRTTDLYDVVTPEKVFLDYCFSHRDWQRNAKNGVGLIVVDLWLTEIRETATSTYTNTQQPGVAGQQSGGLVQPQTPSDQTLAAVGNGGFF